MFCKKRCSEKFCKLHRNHLCWSLFYEVAGPQPADFLKADSNKSAFHLIQSTFGIIIRFHSNLDFDNSKIIHFLDFINNFSVRFFIRLLKCLLLTANGRYFAFYFSILYLVSLVKCLP